MLLASSIERLSATRLWARLFRRDVQPTPEPIDSIQIEIAGMPAEVFGYTGDSYFADVACHVAANTTLIAELIKLPAGGIILDAAPISAP